MLGLILIGCWIVLLIATAFIVNAFRQRQLKMLDQRARQLGFFFDDSGNPFEGSEVAGLSVLRCDPDAIVSRMMTGKISGSPAVVFNLICYGQHCKSVNAVTVGAFRSPIGRLPFFRIGSKNLLHDLKRRIDVPGGNPEAECELGKHLLLQCAVQDKAPGFLTPRKLMEVETHTRNLCIESSADWVFVYRPCTKLKLEAWPSFISEISTIFKILFDADSRVPIGGNVQGAAAGV